MVGITRFGAATDVKELEPVVGPMAMGREYGRLWGRTPLIRCPGQIERGVCLPQKKLEKVRLLVAYFIEYKINLESRSSLKYLLQV